MWREQWQRVLRQYELVRSTNEGRPHDRDSDFYQDEVYAFFQNSYHLKDWLKNDPDTARLVKPSIEDWVKATPTISLCADLANGSKHLKLTRSKTGDFETGIGHRDFELDTGGTDVPIIRVKYHAESGGRTYDAFELATACIAEWKEYLEQNGLV
jgi:hypothetical protein